MATGLFRRSAPRGLLRASSGQALLIAVLVLFAVATLAALFAGIIGSQISQVARQSDLVALRNIAEAGLRLANEQLTYSPAGADWRPGAAPYRCGEGYVTIDVTYGPSPDQLQSRFVRIVSTAVFPDNPFLRHTILALKPVLLTDYARFITDRFETDRAAALGVTGLEVNGISRPDYVSYIEGPIRSNTDVTWYGQSWLSLHTTFDPTVDWRSLGVLRDDRIEIAGAMRPAANAAIADALSLSIDGVSRASNLFAPATEEEQFDYAYGFPRWWEGSIIPNSRTVLAALPDVVTMAGERISTALAVPRVRPPEIDSIHPDKDTNRYLSLTRDSGFWVQDANGFFFNTGEFGWGWPNYGGIYIDNLDDIQYSHDLEKLRLNWTRSVGAHQPIGDLRAAGTPTPRTGPADWWDKTDRYYSPPGVEIILHGDAACPWVEIVRHDVKGAAGAYYYWRDQDGEPIYVAEPEPERLDVLRSDPYAPVQNMCSPVSGPTPIGIYDGNRAVFPFPANGVIYAEGNVRIRGIMPPVRDNQGRSGLGIPVDEVPEGYLGSWSPMSGRSRRFDLQVVSGGTIYVEGDLMSPSTAQLTGLQAVDPAVPLTVTYDQLYGSRVALLARDSVCVNTTALNPRPAGMYQGVDDPANPGTDLFYNDAQLAYPPTFATFPRHWLSKGPTLAASAWDDATPLAASAGATDPILRFIYSNVRLQNPDLRAELASTTELCAILGHAGWYVTDAGPNGEGSSSEPPDARASSRVSLAINTVPHTWDGPSGFYQFIVGAPATPYESNVWVSNAAPGILDFLPQATQSMTLDIAGMTGEDLLSFTAEVMPVRIQDALGNWQWVVDPQDLGYVLGPVAIAPPNRDSATGLSPQPLPVDIDALIYAQNGSWFVMPGRWFNEDPNALVDPSMEYPGYHEPLNIRLSVYGAITENMPADLGSVSDWTSKWGGPVGEGANGFLAYRYDPLLRWSRRETDARAGYLRFPNFPMTSDLVIWGERVSGPAGT